MRPDRRETLRDLFTAVSILIALAAVAFTWLQTREARIAELVRLRPHVDFDIEDDPDVPANIGIAVINAGPGPALIKSVGYFVDGARVKDADAVAAAAHLPRAQLEDKNSDPADSLAVNETFWLLKYHKPHSGKADPMEAERFTGFLDRLAIGATFCSVVDEEDCRFKCSTKGKCGGPPVTRP
jgi:hypothetical protein